MGCTEWTKGPCWMISSSSCGSWGGNLMARVQGTAMQREMVPVVQSRWRYGLKTLFGMERMNALPALVCSAEALRRLVGFNAQHVRHGVCQRGAAKRQGPRTEGPMCPDALAQHLVPLNLRDLEAWFKGTRRALARAGVLGAKVTGIADGTDLETTEHYTGCGGSVPDLLIWVLDRKREFIAIHEESKDKIVHHH